MGVELPVELYIHILHQLPGGESASLTAVLSFLSTSLVTRAAALDKSVWRNLYHSRYTHSIPAKEAERQARLDSDWHAMFVERTKLDRTALQLLDHIRDHPGDARKVPATRLVSHDMSFDVWDALDRESQLPIPRAFRGEVSEDDAGFDNVIAHALPRRFWAVAAKGVIARNAAMTTWCKVHLPAADCGSFEDILTGLSGFMEVSPSEITAQLDQLASRCHGRLLSQGYSAHQLDARHLDCDIVRVITSIRDFIRDEGFAVAEDELFYQPLNQFPHYFLREGRGHTIPISIVYTFTAICRRFQIAAFPTNTPRRVLCYIQSPDHRVGDILFDSCSTTPPVVFSDGKPTSPIDPIHHSLSAFGPAKSSDLLLRVVRNLVTALGTHEQRDNLPKRTWERAEYAASAAFAAAGAVDAIHVLPEFGEDCVLDAHGVLVEALLPHLVAEQQEAFLKHLDHYVRRTTSYEVRSPKTREEDMPAEVFVGQVVTMPEGSLAVVLGWSIENTDIAAVTPRSWNGSCRVLTIGGVVELPAEKLKVTQPTAANIRWLYENIYMFDRFFEDAYIPPDSKSSGGRLIPVPELQNQYPDDLRASMSWALHRS